jgi:hypothetical protein
MLEPRGHGPFIPLLVVVIEISVDVTNTGLQNPPQACGISIQVLTASQSAYSAAPCWSSVARAVPSPPTPSANPILSTQMHPPVQPPLHSDGPHGLVRARFLLLLLLIHARGSMACLSA